MANGPVRRSGLVRLLGQAREVDGREMKVDGRARKVDGREMKVDGRASLAVLWGGEGGPRARCLRAIAARRARRARAWAWVRVRVRVRV